MCLLNNFINDLYQFLVDKKRCDDNIIRRHSRKLEELGDISFPLRIKNWYHMLKHSGTQNYEEANIFEYLHKHKNVDVCLELLCNESKNFCLEINKCVVLRSDVHVFLERYKIYASVIKEVVRKGRNYGCSEVFSKNIDLLVDPAILNQVQSDLDLTSLRVLILKDVTRNLLQCLTPNGATESSAVSLSSQNSKTNVLCGPVLNENNIKDSNATAEILISKRTSDMRMMAQHKYGAQVKPNSGWNEYFRRLGVASVTIEILSNKPQKPLKLCLNNLNAANKGASFIFYNCARLAALFREFEKKISENIYPSLPTVDNVDFSLLTQPEEWELLYVYILQYPLVLRSCVKDIEKGLLNPQYLITFLSNLAQVFSVYYRRVRVLTDPREHLFPVIYSRIYLLKALECVFHNALRILNIEPIREM